MPRAKKGGHRGGGSVIAFIDSGADGRRLAIDQVEGVWSDDPDDDPLVDQVGHGSMTALIAASRADVNGFDGIAPDAKVYILKPKRDERGVLSTAGLMRATDHIAQHAFKTGKRVIVNNSWGLWGCKPRYMACAMIMTRFYVRADRRGLLQAVWAAGNNHLHDCPQPTSNW